MWAPRALAVSEEEKVFTARETEMATRRKAIELIAAAQQAEREALLLKVAAQAEKIASEDRGLALRAQGTTVTGLHVGYMDTDMTARVDAPKADPRDIARQTADAIIAGDYEILADDTTRTVKSHLSEDVIALYAQLAAA